MAKTIPQLTDATTVNAADELIIQQGGITKRATGAELTAGINTINQVINVRDFGAVGDGVTDDRSAFVAAATAATAQSKNLLIPAGTYVLSGGGAIPIGPVRIECYGTLTGAGALFAEDGNPFGGNNFYFHKIGDYETALHLDDWNVTEFDNPKHASLLLRKYYDGLANTSSYYSIGNVVHGYTHYGAKKQAASLKASGSVSTVCGQAQVFSANNGTGAGRTEIQGLAGAVTVRHDASIDGACNYYNELSINGPTGTSASDPQREGFLAGACVLVQKYCPGNTKDANHEGSYGITITTRPGGGGFDGDRPAGMINYKLFAGLAVNGWSGTSGTHTSGSQSAATSAFEWGIVVGGHGSAWTAHDTISKIDTGIGIRDYVFWGLQIFARNPNPNADSGAIAVHSDAGPSVFGMSSAATDTVTKIQAQASGEFDNGIRIWPTSHATSERAGLRLDDWVLAQDSAGNGTKNLFLFQGAAPATRMIVSTSGDVAIGSVAPSSKLHVDGDLTVSNATTAASAAAGSSGDVPAQVMGYLVVNINGTARRIPYYNAP